MYEIPVFSREKQDGLEHAVRTNASIAFHMDLSPYKPDKEALAAILSSAQFATAHETDIDLYVSRSILVTTIWNLNDDIFIPAETWASRYTPIHKPTNIDHNDMKIVGHLTSVWPVTEAGDIIAEATPVDELPDVYNLLTSSVIYKRWRDEAYQQEVNDLIAAIEARTKCVSMECLFANFDYGIITPEGLQHVVARGPESSFLTKHLRAYGGTGEYEGHKVGRVLRQITFSGKGYTDKPANPKSITIPGNGFSFTKANANTDSLIINRENNGFSFKVGVSSKYEASYANKENEMSDTKSYEDKIAALEAEVKRLTSEANSGAVKSLEAKVAELTAKSESDAKTLADEVAKSAELNKKVEASEKALTEASTKLEEVTKAKNELETEVAKTKLETLKANRVSSLVDKGVDKTQATSLVESFADLSDEKFQPIADLAVKAHKPAEAETVETTTATAKPTTDTAVLEKAEVEEQAPLTAEAELANEKHQSAKAALKKFVQSNMRVLKPVETK